MKIGIDLHGVIDKSPEFWVDFAKQIKGTNGEVHIISGRSWDAELEIQLLNYNNGQKWYDYYFSIDDYLRTEKKMEFRLDDKNGRIYPEEAWNSAKAEYCARNQIDIMFDNSPKYGMYFTTPYYHLKD